VDPGKQRTSTRAEQLAATGQNCWPSPGSYTAATGHDLMAADTPESLRQWVRQAEVDRGLKNGPTTEELAEIKALRREVADQQRTIEILKAATTYFAQEADPRPR